MISQDGGPSRPVLRHRTVTQLSSGRHRRSGHRARQVGDRRSRSGGGSDETTSPGRHVLRILPLPIRRWFPSGSAAPPMVRKCVAAADARSWATPSPSADVPASGAATVPLRSLTAPASRPPFRNTRPNQGSTAARAEHGERSAECLDPLTEAEQPRPVRGVSAAHAIVADLELDGGARSLQANVDGRRTGALYDVRERLAAHEVQGGLIQPIGRDVRRDVDRDRDGRGRGKLGDGDRQTTPASSRDVTATAPSPGLAALAPPFDLHARTSRRPSRT